MNSCATRKMVTHAVSGTPPKAIARNFDPSSRRARYRTEHRPLQIAGAQSDEKPTSAVRPFAHRQGWVSFGTYCGQNPVANGSFGAHILANGCRLGRFGTASRPRVSYLARLTPRVAFSSGFSLGPVPAATSPQHTSRFRPAPTHWASRTPCIRDCEVA